MQMSQTPFRWFLSEEKENGRMYEKYFHGCVKVGQKGNRLTPQRFPDQLIDFYGMTPKYQLRARNTAGIVLKALTKSPVLAFRAYPSDFSRSDNTFSIFENGHFSEDIRFSEDDEVVSVHYECKDRGNGGTLLEIYFPVTATVAIEGLDFTNLVPVERTQRKLLCLGDSITQGMVAESAAFSYAAIVSRALDMELHNLGVGGFHFDANSLHGTTIHPDLVTVAYGTNDLRYFDHDIPKIVSNAEAYFRTLSETFAGIPTFVISPIWRADRDTSPDSDFMELANNILQSAKEHGFHAVCGMDLVDHQSSLFSDRKIHPNVRGFIQYADRLLSAIKETRRQG
jgi:hypothetical protein